MTYYRHRVSGPGPAGDIWVTTLHTQGAADLTAAHNAVVTALSAFVDNHFTQYWSPQTAVKEFLTDQLDAVTGKNVAQTSTGVNFVGVGAGKTVSARDSLVISLKTNLPTRAGRGRMYWPSPCSDAYGANGEFLDAVCTELSGAFRNALAAIDGTVTPVIYHRATKTSDNITSVKVGSIPGSQRRRTNKVTNNYSTTNL